MPLVTDRETEGTIQAWARDTFGAPPAPSRIAARANEEMAELLTAVADLAEGEEPAELAAECADILILLCRLSDRLGFDLGAAVDAKMQVNRDRRWTVEQGLGKHLK